MKRESKIKITKICGWIELVIGIFVGILSLLIDDNSLKTFKIIGLIIAMMLLIIGIIFIAYPGVIISEKEIISNLIKEGEDNQV